MGVQQPVVEVQLESNEYRFLTFFPLGGFSEAPAKSCVGGASQFVFGMSWTVLHRNAWVGEGFPTAFEDNVDLERPTQVTLRWRDRVRWSDRQRDSSVLLAMHTVSVPSSPSRKGENQISLEEETRHTKETACSEPKNRFLWIPTIISVSKVLKRGIPSEHRGERGIWYHPQYHRESLGM